MWNSKTPNQLPSGWVVEHQISAASSQLWSRVGFQGLGRRIMNTSPSHSPGKGSQWMYSYQEIEKLAIKTHTHTQNSGQKEWSRKMSNPDLGNKQYPNF